MKTRQKSLLKRKKDNKIPNLKDKFKDKIKLLYDKIKIVFANSIYPDDCNCIICDKEIVRGAKYGLCEDCYNKLPKFERHCITCGIPMDNEAMLCLRCQNNKRYFDFARSCFVYENDLKKLVLKLKFYNGKWVAKYLAQMMYDKLDENDLCVDVVVPVPISDKRLKERGYNQSALLARPIAEKLGVPLVEDAVIKFKDITQQTKLTGKQRCDNVVGAYKVQNRRGVSGKMVLLIDDILTTGSTMNEVARQLKIAGASVVYGLVVASPRYMVFGESLDKQDQNVNTIFSITGDK